jgi:hypothetical protein
LIFHLHLLFQNQDQMRKDFEDFSFQNSTLWNCFHWNHLSLPFLQIFQSNRMITKNQNCTTTWALQRCFKDQHLKLFRLEDFYQQSWVLWNRRNRWKKKELGFRVNWADSLLCGINLWLAKDQTSQSIPPLHSTNFVLNDVKY